MQFLVYKVNAIERAQAHSPSPSAVAYSTVGSEALDFLASADKITALAPAPPSSPDSEPIASPALLAQLGSCTTESELVAAIAPALYRARGFADCAAAACAPVLVNSEAIRWLDALDAPLPADQRKKPDLFVTWTPFLARAAAAHSGSGMVPTGKLASRALQLDGCVAEFYEAKVGSGNLTPADFGQLADYHSRVAGDVRGVLFNARYFWLYHSKRQYPVSLAKGELGARGSQAALRDFFAGAREPPLLLLLRHLMASLGAVPWTPPSAGGTEGGTGAEGPPAASGGSGGGSAPAPAAATGFTAPFLGAGGSARVFAVQRRGSAQPCALKASLTLQRSELEFEYGLMKRAADAGAPVVAVVEGSLTFFYSQGPAAAYGGGGFLLRHVCRPAAVTSLARCKAAFAALQQLHAAGFVHGDARLPNLVLGPPAGAGGGALGSQGSGAGSSGGGGGAGGTRPQTAMLWIDLREGADEALPVNQRADARMLAASVLHSRPGAPLPASVEAAVGTLELGGSIASYAALGAAVWAAALEPLA